jgi:iron-sulfur cluster assembly protein
VEVKTLIEQQDRADLYLRVYVSGGGCSGLQYGMALDENVDPDDETFTAGDIPLVVDRTSLKYLAGAVVDYITTDMGGGFKIENPNAVKSCGCGSSFSADDEEAAGLDTKAGGGCGSCGCH